MFDPITEFDKAVAWVDKFMEGHRIDPYTPEEIREISGMKLVLCSGVPKGEVRFVQGGQVVGKIINVKEEK